MVSPSRRSTAAVLEACWCGQRRPQTPHLQPMMHMEAMGLHRAGIELIEHPIVFALNDIPGNFA